MAAGIVQARIIYTSPRTGQVYDCAGNVAGNRVVEFEDADVLRLAIPKTALTGWGQNIFGIENKNIYMAATFATPGEPAYSPMMYQYDYNSPLRAYYFGGYGGPLSASGAEEKIVDFVIYDASYNVVRSAARGYALKNCGRVLQFGTAFTGWSYQMEWIQPATNISAAPAYLPKQITSLADFMPFIGVNQATEDAIGGWDVSHVNDFVGAFSHSLFNGPIENWDVSGAKTPEAMTNMFWNNRKITRNLSNWCVPYFSTEPYDFSTGADFLPTENKPVWGTCPRGENLI